MASGSPWTATDGIRAKFENCWKLELGSRKLELRTKFEFGSQRRMMNQNLVDRTRTDRYCLRRKIDLLEFNQYRLIMRRHCELECRYLISETPAGTDINCRHQSAHTECTEHRELMMYSKQ